MKKILIILLIGLLLISPVFAASHTIVVKEKRIEGTGTGIVYIVGQSHLLNQYNCGWEEYVINADDYANINIGDEITLESQSGYAYKVIK